MESRILTAQAGAPPAPESRATIERVSAALALSLAAWLLVDPSWLIELRLRIQGRAVDAHVLGKRQSWSDGDSDEARERLRGPGLRKTIRARSDDGRFFEVEASEEAWDRLLPGQPVALFIEPNDGGRAVLRDAPSPGSRRFSRAFSLVLFALAGAWAWRSWKKKGLKLS